MWVVKLGGSLTSDPTLPDWLALLAHLGSGRVTIVGGGGTLADEVRRLHTVWHLDELTAHNMAVLAMCQTAHLMQAIEPQLHSVADEQQIAATLRLGRTVLWQPHSQIKATPDDTTNWAHSSDSLALLLAERLNAERLIVVKRVAPGARTLGELCEDGVLDTGFGALAQRAGFPVHVLGSSQREQMRHLLLGLPLPATPL